MDPIKVKMFRLSNARMKIKQIPCVIFQAISQFSFKLCNTLQCHDIILLKFSNLNSVCFGQKEPIKVQFLDFLVLKLNFTQFLMPFLKLQGQGLFKFCLSVQCHER